VHGYADTVDAREKRMAENETLFREVNERVEAIAHQLGPDVPYEFMCECANADCTFRINLSLAEYERVRADPRQFVVLPLHFTPEVERLVLVRQARQASMSSISIRGAADGSEICAGGRRPQPPR
jgi:hypothetical protein